MAYALWLAGARIRQPNSLAHQPKYSVVAFQPSIKYCMDDQIDCQVQVYAVLDRTGQLEGDTGQHDQFWRRQQ